jgi:hypothetical protein
MRLDSKMWRYRCGCWVLCSPWLWLGYAELATCTSQLGNVNFWIWQSGLEKQVNWTWQKYPGSVIHTSILDLKFGVEHHAEDPLHFERMLISKAEDPLHFERTLISKAPSKFAYSFWKVQQLDSLVLHSYNCFILSIDTFSYLYKIIGVCTCLIW